MFPNLDAALMQLRWLGDDAATNGQRNADVAITTVLTLLETGRAFVGLRHLIAHMPPETLTAFVVRVEREMLRNAAKRNSIAPNAGDLNNDALARALGCADVDAAILLAMRHPQVTPFTFG